MTAFGLSGALSGLSGVYGGMKQGELDEAHIDDVKRGQLAKVAMGNALMLLGGGTQNQVPQGFGPQMAGGPQPPAPGQPSMPPQGPPGMPPGGAPPMQQAGPPGMSGPPGGGVPPRPPMPMGGAPGAGGPPPQLPPGMGGGPPGMGRQALDWRQIVQAVQQSNPNIKPDVMAEAVNQFLPMMNQQSQMEWRMVSLQLREQALQQRERDVLLLEQGRNQRADKAEAGRTDRAEIAADTRRDVAEVGATSRADIAEKNRESREKQTTQRLEQQQRQFEQREGRLQEALKFREDSTWQRLEQQKQQAMERAQQAQGRSGLAQVRAVLDEQNKYIRNKIAAANTIDAKARKQLLTDADKLHADNIKELRDKFSGAPPSDKKSEDLKPGEARTISTERAPVPVPEAFKSDPDGTEYHKDGVDWVKQGDKLVPKGG